MAAFGIIDGILGAVGLAPAALSALKQFFADIAALFGKLGQAKAQNVAQQAADITGTVETDVSTAVGWFQAEYPTIEELLKVFPGLPKLMYSASNIQKDQGVDLHTALTAAQLGANSVKVSQGTAAA